MVAGEELRGGDAGADEESEHDELLHC
jgi:hypothetical protein